MFLERVESSRFLSDGRHGEGGAFTAEAESGTGSRGGVIEDAGGDRQFGDAYLIDLGSGDCPVVAEGADLGADPFFARCSRSSCTSQQVPEMKTRSSFGVDTDGRSR